MNFNYRENKAVTMLTLVITIIIISIIAGVSFSALTGEKGLVSEARNVKDDVEKETIEEQITVIMAKAKVSKNGKAIDVAIEKLLEKKIIDSIDDVDTANGDVKSGKYVFEGILKDLVKSKDEIYVTPEEPVVPVNPIEPEKPDEPEIKIVFVDKKVTITDNITGKEVQIETKGDVEEFVETIPTWGTSIYDGDIFRLEQTQYFVIHESPYVTPGNITSVIHEKGIKMNVEKGFRIPDNQTVEGDLKIENGKVYIYYNGYYSGGNEEWWNNPGYWIEIPSLSVSE